MINAVSPLSGLKDLETVAEFHLTGHLSDSSDILADREATRHEDDPSVGNKTIIVHWEVTSFLQENCYEVPRAGDDKTPDLQCLQLLIVNIIRTGNAALWRQ